MGSPTLTPFIPMSVIVATGTLDSVVKIVEFAEVCKVDDLGTVGKMEGVVVVGAIGVSATEERGSIKSFLQAQKNKRVDTQMSDM